MDFFQAQDDARRRTGWLIVWFGLAVGGVIGVIYLLTVLGLRVAGERAAWSGPEAMGAALGVGVLIILASLFKHLHLAGGGAVVARDLGGRQVDPSTTDPYERRLLNVVEEMAIASGIPSPQVWVLADEDGINAFAAGSDPGDAVIGVTRGCLERLSRAELQGVVAHEFSHILNGDMRLNLRLLGWVFGLVVLAVVGRMVVSSLRHVRLSSGGGRDRGGAAGVVLAVLAIGVSLWIVGSIGVFFARLIQAAISRQREYLADASAVQFTREPSGIAGALKKIGGFAGKGAVESPRAPEAKHMFFADAGRGFFKLGTATHPPLDQRIRAIDPSWNGKFVEPGRVQVAREGSRGRVSEPPPLPGMVAAAAALDELGQSNRVQRAAGDEVLARLDAGAAVAVRNREDAKALMYGLLLAQDDKLRGDEVGWLRTNCGTENADRALDWNRELATAGSAEKIAYMDLALPALRRMGREEREQFLGATRWLIAADGEVDLFEFMLRKMLARHLGEMPPPRGRRKSLAAFEQEARLLATTFAGLSDEDADSAFAAAAESYREQTGRTLERLPTADCSMAAIDRALDRCSEGSAVVRRQLLRLCGLAAVRDDKLDDQEVELLRAVADAIGTPIPPFVERLSQAA